jgi:hypothetical protein
MRVLIFAALFACTGCTWQSTGKPWTAGDYAAQVATFGMYGAFKGDADNATADVNRCVAQGGDPVGCRRVVYGRDGLR